MRKQVEQAAGCFILTAQEAPETNKRMREDLFKKTMSADGIAGRRPYGMVTRMIELTGWKRYEVNRMIKFAGVSEENIHSIFRRGFVWKPMARFIDEAIIATHFPDANTAGYFAKDDSLKDFLRSGPCIAAALRLQHGFELKHGRSECAMLIENYASQPLTEDAMRAACSLPPKHRSADRDDLILPVDPPSQDMADELRGKLQSVADAIRDDCFARGRLSITQKMFRSLKLPSLHPSDMTRDQIWDELVKRKMILTLSNTSIDAAMPAIDPPVKLCTLFAVKTPGDKSETAYEELHDTAGLVRYAKNNADREANAYQTIAYLDKCLTTLKRKGSGKLGATVAKAIEDLTRTRDKMALSEELLERVCQREMSASMGGEDAGEKRRRLSRKTSSTPDIRKFSYERDFQGIVRTRAYVHGDGAQKWRRRMLRVLCPQTHDLDICNAVFDILHQLVIRLDLKKTMPGNLAAALERLAEHRSDVCANDLQVSVKEGKSVLHEVLFGGTVPPALAEKEFLRTLQHLSFYLRWTACSVLPEVYHHVRAMKAKKRPESSTLFYLYALAENHILEAWEQHVIESFKPKHLSLHFDGLRIDHGCISQKPMREICQSCELAIQERTGFKVKIVEKAHEYFLDICKAVGHTRDDYRYSGVLSQRGNCIPLALAQLYPHLKEKLLGVLARPTDANSQASSHASRCYKSVLDSVQLHAVPHLGLNVSSKGKYLLHTENGGAPHCVSCDLCDDGSILLGDIDGVRSLTAASLKQASDDAIDGTTLVTYRIFEKQADVVWPEGQLKENLEMLLELYAGAQSGAVWLEGISSYVECCPDQRGSDDEDGFAEPGEAEDGTIEISSFLLSLLKDEVAGEMRRPSGQMNCPFCPFRRFARADRKQRHISTYHTVSRQYVCSGTKQLKLLCALFDYDQVACLPGKDYLRRSALMMADTVAPPLRSKLNEIDRHIRLVLTEEGPAFFNFDVISDGETRLVRRARNLYYTRGFAEMIYKEFMLCNGKCSAVSRPVSSST